MANKLPRALEIAHCSGFKHAMWNLCKERHLTFEAAENAMCLGHGFVEKVERNLHELTLGEVKKIAEFFHTTMDSVLDGGNVEFRVRAQGVDELGHKQSSDCFKAYAKLLNDLAMEQWKPGLFEEEVRESKLQLERCQRIFVDHYKAYMDEKETKDRVREIVKCEDEVLINELLSRGYKVEKDGK